jgi:uncharacterized protein YabE (DUF348 family)
VARGRLVALVPLLLGLTACGPEMLRAERVADGAEKALEEQVGVRPEVTCPEDLEATVGAKGRCTVTAPGDPTTYGVTVTVTEVDGEEARYAVAIDDQPQG